MLGVSSWTLGCWYFRKWCIYDPLSWDSIEEWHYIYVFLWVRRGLGGCLCASVFCLLDCFPYIDLLQFPFLSFLLQYMLLATFCSFYCIYLLFVLCLLTMYAIIPLYLFDNIFPSCYLVCRSDGLLAFVENFVKDHFLPTMFVDYRKSVQQAISSKFHDLQKLNNL